MSFYPSLFSLTRLNIQLLYSNAFFILPYKLFLHSPSSPFSLNFLSTFCSLCFLLCTGNFHSKSLKSLAFFFSFLNYCFPYHPLIDPSLFLPPISPMFAALCLTVISYLHLAVSGYIWAERALLGAGSVWPVQSEGKWLLFLELCQSSAPGHWLEVAAILSKLSKTVHLRASTELNEMKIAKSNISYLGLKNEP